MRAFVAATPFLMLAIMLWVAWRVLEVFRSVLIPARIRHIQSAADGTAVLLLETREPEGRAGEARLELPHAGQLAPGQRVTLWRGERLMLARFGYPTLVAATLGGIVVFWVALYLPFM